MKYLRVLAFAALAVFLMPAVAGVINGPNDHVGHGVVIDASKLMAPVAGSDAWRVGVLPVPAPLSLQTPLSDMGAFRTSCAVSHMAFDDPIAKPGQPGKSHLHTFAGNTAADAFTTAENIRTRGATTCPGGLANMTAYWVPTIIDTIDGTPIKPFDFSIYYKSSAPNRVPTASVQPMPDGLRMIAGDMTNTVDVWKANTQTWNFSPYIWQCIDRTPGMGYAVAKGQQIPACPAARDGNPAHMELWATLVFPRCVAVDAAGQPLLDSPNHKSHMAYAGGTGCPATHPIPIPEITFNVEYAVPSTGTASWRLSSDMDDSVPPGRTMHGDWFDGWSPEIKRAWITNCAQPSRDCHSNLLGDGRILQ